MASRLVWSRPNVGFDQTVKAISKKVLLGDLQYMSLKGGLYVGDNLES